MITQIVFFVLVIIMGLLCIVMKVDMGKYIFAKIIVSIAFRLCGIFLIAYSIIQLYKIGVFN